MQLLACSIAILAVTVIYLFWRSHAESLARRRRVLRDRVASLLWAVADVEEEDETVPAFDSSADVF